MKKALGKGLNALLPSSGPTDKSYVAELEITAVEPNPEQPRRHFDEDAIGQLAESIAAVGLVQPIIVKDEGTHYKIIAGERRWRAARIAGLTKIPAIIGDYTNEQCVELALVENLQRMDLNPIEEASGYERLIAEYGYSHERIAKAVGKSRPAIANSIRLLKLSNIIKDKIIRGDISAGHARALLSIDSPERREAVAEKIIEQGLNVRQAEKLANNIGGHAGKGVNTGKGANAGKDENAGAHEIGGDNVNGQDGGDDRDDANANLRQDGPDARARKGESGANGPNGDIRGLSAGTITPRAAAYGLIEDELRSHFNTHVTVAPFNGKTGKIIIEYYDEEGLQKILDQIGIKNA